MYNVINPPFMGIRTPASLPIYEYAIRNIKKELTRITNYYRNSIFVIPNTHFLRRLVNDLERFMSLNPTTIKDAVRESTIDLCKSYNITSPLNNGGIISNGVFYNRNNPEAYLNIENDFNADLVYKNYKDVKAIRVLQHGFTDLAFTIPNGNYGCQQKDICVFGIDIAMLAVQYKGWVDQEQYSENIETNLPLHDFIHKYVLVNMISTHMDVSIFNRMRFYIETGEFPAKQNNHNFSIVDFAPKIDEGHKRLYDLLKTSLTDWQYRMDSLPSVDYGSYRRSQSIPDVAPNTYVKWLLVLSKINTLDYLMSLDKLGNNREHNIGNRRSLKLDFEIMMRERSIQVNVPTSTLGLIKSIYGELK